MFASLDLVWLLDSVIATTAILVTLPIAVFSLEVLASIWPVRRRRPRLGRRPRVAVLVPAHDEGAGIAHTLESLFRATAAGDRVLVVADNCSDDTAEVARALGAEVVERTHETRRGKGYALQFGVAHLRETSPPEVLVVVDADCEVTSESLTRLAETVVATGRPAQSSNLATPDANAGALQAVSTLGFRFKNLVRTTGAERLGWPCHLMGTGMALPWDVLESVSFGGETLAEDMQLGVDLAIQGRPGVFEPGAEVTSAMPRKDSAFVTQRTRWERGHVTTSLRNVPRLLSVGIRHLNWSAFGLALDLCVPPLSMLVLGFLLAFVVAGAAIVGGLSAWPWLLLVADGTVLGLAILLGWFVHCRHQVHWRTFASVPWFVLRKVPIYLSMSLRRRTAWVRTARDVES